MKWLTILLSSIILAACGGNGEGSSSQTAVDPQITTVPGLSENRGTDINLYKLDPLRIAEASVILPPDSPTTLQEVQQSAIFSIIRTPFSGDFNEGNIDNALVITLKVLNVPNRTRVPYIITGIDAADIESMVLNGASMPPALAGYFDLGSQGAVGFANLVLIFKSDQITEGSETLSLRLGTGWANVDALTVNATINDTSTTPPPPVVLTPTYSLVRNSAANINEGLVATPTTFTLTTTNVPIGTRIPWTITGSFVTLDDIGSMVVNGTPQTPSLSGDFIVNASGSTTMVLTFRADNFTEGAETLVLGLPTVPGTPTASVTINDTSTTPPTLVDTVNPIISITQITNFTANSSMTVNGVSVDNVGISSVTWINRIDGNIVGQGSATLTQFGNYATWTANVPLQLGNNNVEFLTTDVNGRTAYEIIVVSGSVAMVSGQSSLEAVPTENIESTEEVIQTAEADATADLIQQITSGMREFREFGLDTDKVINVASLGIPMPPAEVHPCNKGYFLHMNESFLHSQYKKPKTGWWLLASSTNRENTDPTKVNFYWATKISDGAYGVYDTGIRVDNTKLRIGLQNAKLDLGWKVVPYNWSTYMGIAPLPLSRTEVCEA